LGLEPMSQYDAHAPVMTGDFAATVNTTAWSAVPETVDLSAVNPGDAKGTRTSARFDLRDADRAESAVFNRVLMDWVHAERKRSRAYGSSPS